MLEAPSFHFYCGANLRRMESKSFAQRALSASFRTPGSEAGENFLHLSNLSKKQKTDLWISK